MKKFVDKTLLTDKEYFASTYKKECFVCPCGKIFGTITIDVDTELECEECGTLITFEPVTWKVHVEKGEFPE